MGATKSKDANLSEMNSENILEMVPPEIFAHICTYLNGHDVISSGKTCKYLLQITQMNSLWKAMIKYRFGSKVLDPSTLPTEATNDPVADKEGFEHTEVDTAGSTNSPVPDKEAFEQTNVDTAGATSSAPMDYKALYFRLARSKKSILDMSVVWLNDRYLLREADTSALTGEVVHLYSVCWLQIDGIFKGVLPGTYSLLWRMKVQVPEIEGTTLFRAAPAEGCGDVLEKGLKMKDWRRIEKKKGKDTWYIENFGKFTVHKICDVKLEIRNTKDSTWKSGVSWDYAQLMPCT